MTKRSIYIAGPFNTGTNLVNKIISKCNCIDLIKNQPLTLNETQPFHKHTVNMQEIEKYLENPNNLLIIMYKNPYNWLYSIKKAPYDIKYTKMFLPVTLYGKTFPNMLELYNFYYINYMSILKRHSNCIFLDYGKIIDKNTSYDYFNNKLSKIYLSINSKDNFHTTLNAPAKNHGSSVNNVNEAYAQYLNIQNMVKQFVQKRPNFRKSIKPILINYHQI